MLLYLVKTNKINSITEKKIYTFLSAYIRAPGCTYTLAIGMNGIFNYYTQKDYTKLVTLMITIFFNFLEWSILFYEIKIKKYIYIYQLKMTSNSLGNRAYFNAINAYKSNIINEKNNEKNNENESNIVNIPDYGKIKGYLDTSMQGTNNVYAFLGVPYANPPVGENRFRPPTRLNKLNENEILNATNIDNNRQFVCCPQENIYKSKRLHKAFKFL